MTASDKRSLRKAVRAEIAKLTEEDKREQSAQIFNHIESLDVVADASVIALFASLADEPQTHSIIERLARDKRILLPRIEGDDMDFYDIGEGVHHGAFGIMEPSAAMPITPSEIDVMMVPGVAFTREGARLGRGKGFYDRYIAREGFRAATIGVCYPCQIVERIPTEDHDKKIERIIYK